MPDATSRAKFFKANPRARALAALDHATNRGKKITPGAIKLKKDHFAGKTAVVIGSGVGGLTTAYELLAQHSGMQVTVLEALNRSGGRCLSLRTGDTLTEDADSQLFDSEPGETQVVRFSHPTGDAEPYLNAGPGRIPSSHKRLLHYLRQFGVPVEVYVMNSESNLTQLDEGRPERPPFVYRRLDHNTRGRLAELVYANAETLVPDDRGDQCHSERVEQLRDLMVSFGELSTDGSYRVNAGEDGMENGHTRAGYTELPGVSAGKVEEALSLDQLLDSEFWDKTRFYQPVDFLWQSTLFQPVGGMDRVQHAFAQQVATLGGNIQLNSPVKEIDWCPTRKKFRISVSQIGTDKPRVIEADYCFCNAAMPFLKRILSDRLKGKDSGSQGALEPKFVSGLEAVFDAQFNPDPATVDEAGYPKRFLACTTKVGWQADRRLWQGSDMCNECVDGDSEVEVVSVPASEVGVVPIFGGISWTAHPIVQVWYPSNAYHDKLGVLTGAYNFSKTAYEWGQLPVAKRLEIAREGAAGFGRKFSEGLKDGVAIAWQNMPHIKGGWAQWDTVKHGVDHFNVIAQGSGICDDQGKATDPCFFIVGDQISSLPGWQEGAIASALNAITRAHRPDYEIPYLAALPDTRLMVEGI